VGDDDQNIFEFRGSDSLYLYQLSKEPGSRFIEMIENYRSSKHVVDFANAFVKVIGKRMKGSPIISMRNDEGHVEVTQHSSQFMYQPLVDNLIAHRGHGTSCVLTQTNEEAVILVALLRKHGIQSKLIQSMEGFRFSNLAEVKYLLKYISKKLSTPLIPDELWEEAKRATFSKYDGSLSVPYLERCVKLFEQIYRAKYSTDLWEFVFESSVEDFCDVSNTEVVVSTIHKAKGREFDDVYMLIADSPYKDEKLFRQLYVGMTRAKRRLFIHTNSDLFNRLPADIHKTDNQQYPLPEEIVLQLSHKDVYLDFFKNIKQEVLALQSGDDLLLEDNYFLVPSSHRAVAKLSTNMQTIISTWNEKGYIFHSASVRFVVAWKSKDAPKEEPESAVLLIDLHLVQ
jgi:ATP-dependent DNA helicase RecQ